jgi:hypothetical protein
LENKGVEMIKPTFKYLNDLSPADWIFKNLSPDSDDEFTPLSTLIPKGFQSYISIRHDNALFEEDSGSTIDWEIFTKNLISFTTTPDDCFYALWNGYGMNFLENQAELFVRLNAEHTPVPLRKDEIRYLEFPLQREYLLFQGKLLESLNLNFNDPLWHGRARPNWAWPTDKSWIYFNEIDFEVTLLAGSEELISAIERNPLYKTERFRPETPIKDIYLVAPWNMPDISDWEEASTHHNSLRSRLSRVIISLGFWISDSD